MLDLIHITKEKLSGALKEDNRKSGENPVRSRHCKWRVCFQNATGAIWEGESK